MGVYIWDYEQTIRAIQFQTTKERMSPRYGGADDGDFRCIFGLPTRPDAKLMRPESGKVRVLAGLRGSADAWVRQVGVSLARHKFHSS